jgi:AAA family ATP:ADP antiporter
LTSDSRDNRSFLVAASVAAMAMIAYQVGGKATRDAFFLSMYPVRYLPAMVAVTSAAALALAYGSTRALSAWGPERLIPTAFLVSGLLMLVEWGVSFVAPGPASILLYAHYGCLGALLVSGFWQFVNERFDPRTAKRQLGRLTAAATVGGLLGGIAASQIAGVLPLTTMIPILALLHIACAVVIARMGPLSQPVATVPGTRTPTPVPRAEEGGRLNPHTVARTPYIRALIGLVLLATVSEGLIDLVLKGRASMAMHDQARLLQFFAYFYTATSLVTVLVQTALSRWLLERLGPARSAAALPAGVAIASATAVALPGLGSTIVARAVETVLSNSLFRAGYEVLFTPVPQREKRAIKSLADVGTSRMGDILAAGMAQAVLVLGMQHQGTALFVMAMVLSTAGFFVALGLHRGYVGALARGLRSRAVQLDISDVQDGTTRSTVLQTLGPLALSQIMRLPRAGTDAGAEGVRSTATFDLGQDAAAAVELARIRDLHSRDPARVRRALAETTIDGTLTPHVIPLLGWDDVASDALASLRRATPEAIGPLVTSLLDPEVEFTIRRRIPLVLATHKDRRAVEGLQGGLRDPRFEVRYRCGRGLAHLSELDPSLSIPSEEAFAAVLREVQAGAGVWESRKVLDRMDDDSWSPVLDEVLQDRANRSLEHVFTLLALALPRQPLKIAFKGLHTTDPLLRGTALEYLETTLPPDIRKALWPYLEDNRPRRPGPSRTPDKVLSDLLDSSASIVIRLDEIRRAEGGKEG